MKWLLVCLFFVYPLKSEAQEYEGPLQDMSAEQPNLVQPSEPPAMIYAAPPVTRGLSKLPSPPSGDADNFFAPQDDNTTGERKSDALEMETEQ
ncbi:hypothetical protein ACCS88_21055 [Rhizobium ruizarguesonis]